jgi:hypothetical protein
VSVTPLADLVRARQVRDFIDLGYIDDDIESAPNPDRAVKPWDSEVISTIQADYSITIEYSVESFNIDVLAMLFGPLYALAWQFRQINPHWYLERDT